MKILLLMSGSIACAKATGLLSLWKKSAHEVKVVCTKSVFEFVGKATLEGLSGNPVFSQVFEDNNMMQHINLSRWADKIVFAPATADSINKLAAGIADDMVTSTWVAALALKKPMYLVPAMNTMMWNYPATKESINKLTNWGINLLNPQTGELACGEQGTGRMMEIEDINKGVFPQKNTNKSLLITAGGTREYIDGVRYIGNLSTGKTGAQMADYFSSHGYNVTWLGARNAIQPQLKCKKIYYETFKELSYALQEQLQNTHFDNIIHAAAISDFYVDSLMVNGQNFPANRTTKLATADTLNIQLKKNPKLITSLKKWSKNNDIKIMAFKLTNTKDKNKQAKAVAKLFDENAIDYVAHNDLSEITENQHLFTLYQNITDFIQLDGVISLCKNLSDYS